MNRLYTQNEIVFFEDTTGQVISMPNLTELYKLYLTTDSEEVKERIADIFGRDFGKVLVAEIMVDMNNERTIERLHTGEISKTLRHVDNYNVILESELELVKASYDGDFESACFAKFPYGMAVEEEKFAGYKNGNCEAFKLK